MILLWISLHITAFPEIIVYGSLCHSKVKALSHKEEALFKNDANIFLW